MSTSYFQIRDPIHGVIAISKGERAIIDSRVFQRLRNIKQVGFADFAFPCATHSRYSHSLGAMFVASKIFERVVLKEQMKENDWQRLHQAVRLAALLHDVGHPPLSHTTEMMMPKIKDLNSTATEDRRASHEDYTLKLIVDSSLTALIADEFSQLGLSPQLIADLVGDTANGASFKVNGIDYAPLMRQIISSEIDADRMDYLLRDSFFCGVNYGKFDAEWLIDNLIGVAAGDQMFLGLRARAIFAFEDFLLSRYHMFASVYLHHTPVIMEKMLERFFEECPEAFSLPGNIDDYIALDDVDLWHALKQSDNRWAKRIVERRPYLMLEEIIGGDATNFDAIIKTLKAANIDVISSYSKSFLSKYRDIVKHPVYVESSHKQAVPLEDFSQLFIRYQSPAEISRIFVDAKDRDPALAIIKNVVLKQAN